MVDSFEYDEIDYWTEVKHDIVRQYAEAYTTVMSTQSFKHIYIDAFAGPGMYISKRTGKLVKGSSLNALGTKTPFSEIHLIDSDPVKVAALRELSGTRPEVHVHKGDANTILPEQVFPHCKYTDFCRALCLLDPYGLDVDWKIVEQAGQMRSVEIFYNFMVMDAHRNVLWRNRENVNPAQIERMDFVWGDRTWEKAAYVPQLDLFGGIKDQKEGNPHLAETFRKRLHDKAGFQFVPEPIPMKNGQGAVIYYLFFGSNNKTGAEIVRDIFDKHKARGVQ
jgi:three-Cys-motif partner protein